MKLFFLDFSKDLKESPLGFRGVDVEGVGLGDSPTADTLMRGMPDYSATTGKGINIFPMCRILISPPSLGSLGSGSGVRPAAKQMTVTSPPAGWSGTSWTGGLAQGCAPAFKTSASVNDLNTGV